jgi:hypothetical protein
MDLITPEQVVQAFDSYFDDSGDLPHPRRREPAPDAARRPISEPILLSH